MRGRGLRRRGLRTGRDVSFDAVCFGFDAARTGRFSLDADRFGFDVNFDAVHVVG